MRYLVAFQEVVMDSFMRPKLQNVFSSRERHPKTSANKDFGFDFSAVETRDHTATLTSPKWVISLSALNKCWSQRRKNKTLWKRQRPQALERKSCKNKTVWKWNILLSIKRWANMFWKWVKCEVWTSMVVYGNSGATCFSVADIQIRQKKNWKLSTMFTWAKTKWKWGRCSLGGRTLFFTPPRQHRRTASQTGAWHRVARAN